MQLQEFYRTSHSDIDAVYQQVRKLGHATASMHLGQATVTLRFTIDGQPGWIMMRAKPDGLRDREEVNQRRAIAAARTQQRGKPPMVWRDVQDILGNHIGPRAIGILTNPEHYDVIGLAFQEIRYGTAVTRT